MMRLNILSFYEQNSLKGAEKLAKKASKPKWEVEEVDHSDVKKKITDKFESDLRNAFKETDNKKRSNDINENEISNLYII